MKKKKKGMDFFLPFGTQLSGRDEPACYCEFPLPDMDLVVETGDYIGLKVKFFLNRFLKPVEKAKQEGRQRGRWPTGGGVSRTIACSSGRRLNGLDPRPRQGSYQ